MINLMKVCFFYNYNFLFKCFFVHSSDPLRYMCQQCFLAIHVQILIEQTVTWDYRLICSTGWFAMLSLFKTYDKILDFI